MRRARRQENGELADNDDKQEKKKSPKKKKMRNSRGRLFQYLCMVQEIRNQYPPAPGNAFVPSHLPQGPSFPHAGQHEKDGNEYE
jgi:hypothetical protein